LLAGNSSSRDSREELISSLNSTAGDLMRASISSNDSKLKEWEKFELKVVRCPDYLDDWKYPREEMKAWIESGNFEEVEIHKFEL